MTVEEGAESEMEVKVQEEANGEVQAGEHIMEDSAGGRDDLEERRETVGILEVLARVTGKRPARGRHDLSCGR